MARNLFLLVSVLIWSSTQCNAQKTLYASAPSERGAYYVKGKNVYNYGYNTGDGIAKVEARHPDGSVTGSYRYFDPLGRQIVRSYVADHNGFRVLGNALPVGPDTPAVGVVPEETLYGTAEGTGDDSGSNHHTSTFLQRDNESTSSNRIEAVQRKEPAHHQSSSHLHQQNELIRKQEQLIRQHEQALEKLRLEKDRLYRQQSSNRRSYSPDQYETQKSGTQFAQGGYYSSVDNVDPLRGIYFYHNRKKDYDFPAGFKFADPSRYDRSAGSQSLLQFTDQYTDGVRYRPLYNRRT